jgi:hypothetical protein
MGAEHTGVNAEEKKTVKKRQWRKRKEISLRFAEG